MNQKLLMIILWKLLDTKGGFILNNRVKEIKTKGFSFIPEKDNASIDPNNANFTKLKVGIKTTCHPQRGTTGG